MLNLISFTKIIAYLLLGKFIHLKFPSREFGLHFWFANKPFPKKWFQCYQSIAPYCPQFYIANVCIRTNCNLDQSASHSLLHYAIIFFCYFDCKVPDSKRHWLPSDQILSIHSMVMAIPFLFTSLIESYTLCFFSDRFIFDVKTWLTSEYI